MINLYNYNTPKKGEIFDTLLEHKNIKIIRIISSDEVDNKLYIQDEDEWVVVVEGEAILEINDIEKKLSKGESIFIGSKVPHRVIKTQNGTVWLAISIY
ncbi:Uncharacterized conserved protein [hydrothermal vent metagenome]|uniref:Uncharacterized conserved protein n=1 Tax=hydrothermal vent metagenome TaxID=652676 RepID=A0A1W1C0S1_9ZZZZ